MRTIRASLLIGAAAAGLALSSSAKADSIGLNFTGGSGGNPVSVSGTAGVVPQANWNNAGGPNSSSAQALVLGSGAASGASATWSSSNTWDTGGTPANDNANLMFGYLDNNLGQNGIAAISNLPASIAGSGSTPYNVYVYFAADTAGRGGSLMINGATYSSFVNSGPASDGTFIQATAGASGTGVGATPGNYALFTGITGTNLQVNAIAESIGDNQRLAIDGIQVVSSAATPEPAGLGLIGLVGAGLLARRKRGQLETSAA